MLLDQGYIEPFLKKDKNAPKDPSRKGRSGECRYYTMIQKYGMPAELPPDPLETGDLISYLMMATNIIMAMLSSIRAHKKIKG